MKTRWIMFALAGALFASPGCAEKETDVDEGYKEENVEGNRDAGGNEAPSQKEDTNAGGRDQGN